MYLNAIGGQANVHRVEWKQDIWEFLMKHK